MEDGEIHLLMWKHLWGRKHDKRWWDPSGNLLEVSSFLYRKEDASQDQYYGQVLCSSEEDRRSRKIRKIPCNERGIFLSSIFILGVIGFLEELRDSTEIVRDIIP